MEKKFVFPKVDLPEVGRSNHNLDKSQFISFSPGTARVLWARDVLPRDHWEVSFNASIESLPMLAPLYGAFKATWAFYFEPWSNIYGYMDNNKRQSTEQIIKNNLLRYTIPSIVQSPGEASTTAFENSGFNSIGADYFELDSVSFQDADFRGYNVSLAAYANLVGVSPSSIWEDFGWPTNYKGSISQFPDTFTPIGDADVELKEAGLTADHRAQNISIPLQFNIRKQYLHGIKPFAYLDVIRNYYVNNQLDYAAYIGLAAAASDIVSGSVQLVRISVLDYIFALLRSLDSTSYHIPDETSYQTLGLWFENLTPLNGQQELHSQAVQFLYDWQNSMVLPNGGCFLTNYAMDLNRGLLASTVGNYKSTVDTSSGSFSIETLRMQNKLQQLIDILDLTGGRFSDWVRALWSVDIKGDVDKPIYIGSVSQTISTTDVISPSTTEGSVAGSQTGFAAGGLSSRKITFNSDIYGTIMCVFTYTPIVSYSNLFKREDLKTTFQGVYNPRMAQLGYQDVPQKVLSAETPTVMYSIEDAGQVMPALWKGTADSKVNLPIPTHPYDEGDYLDNLVGKQVAWAEYMSDIDETRGIFALNESLEYWALNRDYFYKVVQKVPEFGGEYLDEVLYNVIHQSNYFDSATWVDPAQWQNLFADVEPNAQNFRQFYKFNVFVKRPIPKRTLGRL